MFKMNLQLFAHKKGVGRVLVLRRTEEIPSPRDWGPREQTDSLYWLATFSTDSAERRSILV